MTASSTSRDAPLLPGELRRSDLLEDAEHWAAVYEELTAFLVDAHHWCPETIERFELRLAYWRERLEELAVRTGGRRCGAAPCPVPRISTAPVDPRTGEHG